VTFVVEPARAGERADRFLARALGVSRRAAQLLLARGEVHCGGRVVHKGELLTAGQELEVRHAPGGEEVVAEPQLALRIVFTSAELCVVDKPAGMPTHPQRPGERGTAANALVARFPELRGLGDPRECGAVHRLDAGTSGLLCFARSPASYAALRAAFREGRVDKGYLALCLGAPPDRGGCALPIGRAGPRAHRAKVAADPRAVRRLGALPAETRFEVEGRYPGYALVRATTHTGRMHQVRVHLAHLGFPLAGDALYQNDEERRRDTTGLTRPFLHATRLRLPLGPSWATFESPLPQELRAVLASLS
jgi:23S rRNA pseudouridine1911/1915/1917 synthase